MSLFRKPRKTIQRRVFSEQGDDEEPGTMEQAPPPPQIVSETKDMKPMPEKVPKQSKQSLLSFEMDEEGEVFQVRKSSQSKKMMRMYEKERKRKEHGGIREPRKERETELRPKDKTKQEIITDDLVVVIKNSYDQPQTSLLETNQMPSPPPAPILSGRDALCAGKDDMSTDDDDDDPDSVVQHRFSKPNNVKKVLEAGAIPDAAMIHAARKRRQRAREQGDFIPVEDEDAEEKNKDTGRLVREDEHEGSDEDRIDMGANPVQRDQERRREQFYEAAQDSDQDELHEWEDQQIRKGVTAAALNQQYEYGCEYNAQLLVAAQVPYTLDSASDPSFAMPVIDDNLPKTPESIVARLQEHYDGIIASREQHKKQLEQIQCDVVRAADELETLKLETPKAAQRFRFYQELRGYLADLVECLDEKMSKISELEQRAIETMARKSEWIVERRRQDVRDQAEEAASVNKSMLGAGALSAANAQSPEEEEKLRRAVEREGRRTRRRRARETASNGSANTGVILGSTSTSTLRHVEGMSSDDELPPQECLVLDKEQQSLEVEVKSVFDDVVDDYSTVSNVLIRFEEWRERDPGAYNDAYITLCLPKVVSPLIRLQLIFWDPLGSDSGSQDLEKLDWYRTLALYGLHDDETEDVLTKDPDIILLPTIIDKLVVPKLTRIVEKSWDPMSSSQTLRLVGVITRCVRRFPTLGPDSRSLTVLMTTVLERIRVVLEHDVFIPISSKLAESRSPFFQRQFASGLKLLRNITCWQGLINDNTLKDLALNKLLNRYLLSGIRICQLTDAVSKVGLISHILPRVWLQSDIEELKLFNHCVMQLAQQLDKGNPVHLESIDILTNVLKNKRM